MRIPYKRRFCSFSWHDNPWTFPSHALYVLMPCPRTFSTSPSLFPWPNVVCLLLSPKQQLKGIAPSLHLDHSFTLGQHPHNQPIDLKRRSQLRQYTHISFCQLHIYSKPWISRFNCEERSQWARIKFCECLVDIPRLQIRADIRNSKIHMVHRVVTGITISTSTSEPISHHRSHFFIISSLTKFIKLTKLTKPTNIGLDVIPKSFIVFNDSNPAPCKQPENQLVRLPHTP